MRKSLSYIFILLMFMNVLGYYWVLTGLHYNSTQSLEKKISVNNYDNSETVTFKFHLTLPYVGDQSLTDADGQFEYNGEYYHLVKQQYANDTLQLVCVKNHNTKRISSALRDYVKTFADQPGNESKSAKDFSNLIKDYLGESFDFSHSSIGWTTSVAYLPVVSGNPISFHATVTQPPELL